MLQCWSPNPKGRPSFQDLAKLMSEMEEEHGVKFSYEISDFYAK